MNDYPWYALVDKPGEVRQGDLIYSCHIIVPTSDIHMGSGQKGEVQVRNAVVMSQSCDIEQKNIDLVLVCPFVSLNDIDHDLAKTPKGREKFRQGNLPGYHLLNKCKIEGFETDFLVVDFRNVFVVPLTYLSKKVGPRVRLLPPYREHLSQAFARFFMRVGLPIDIPKFTK
ncbi:hypothetical protein ACFL6S_09730 [Candidatus Poribacteria bacterium]